MTDVDLVLLAIIGISALLGLWRGLIRVLVSLAAWLLGGIAAVLFGADVAKFLAGAGALRPVHLLAGYGASFVAVFLVVIAVGWLVRRLVQSVGLSGVDRVLGLAFGVARGGLIACLLVVVMGFTSFPQRPGWRDSQLLPLLLPGARSARAWLPDWSALPVGRVDAIQDTDFNSKALNGARSNNVNLNRTGMGGHGVLRSALNAGESNSADLDGRDSRGDKPHSSNGGDAPALPQPGG